MKRAALLAVLALGLLAAPTPAGAECAGGHLGVRWASFQAPITNFSSVTFYHSVEPAAPTNLSVVVMGSGDDCSNPTQPVHATYEVRTPASVTSRPATEGLDYEATSGETGPLFGSHGEPTEHPDEVPILPDAAVEPVAEQAQATITSSTGRRDLPWEVPLYIVDDDGAERASFASAGPYERSETYGLISVPIFRAGAATGESTYAVAVTGSSASPATAGEDYVLAESAVTFSEGERVELLQFQLSDDRKAESPEELTLRLTEPGPVTQADPIEATVRILDSVGASGLQSRLHHPRPQARYRSSDFRIREIHIFTTPGVGPPVTSSEFALRRNTRGGTCSWWTGKRFRGGDCQNERWLRTRSYEPDFFYYRLREMKPSTGSIKSYTAFSRAKNGAGEVEVFIEQGRNANTFRIREAG